MTMEKQAFEDEDVFPMKNGGCSIVMLLFRGSNKFEGLHGLIRLEKRQPGLAHVWMLDVVASQHESLSHRGKKLAACCGTL